MSKRVCTCAPLGHTHIGRKYWSGHGLTGLSGCYAPGSWWCFKAFFGKAFTKNALFKSSDVVCWLLLSPHSAFDREDLETVKLLLNSKMYIAIASRGDPEFHKEDQVSVKIDPAH